MDKKILLISIICGFIMGIALLQFFFGSFNTQITQKISTPTPSITSTPIANNFVTAKGTNLLMNGHMFRSIGVNRYNLLTHMQQNQRIGCANPFEEADIDAMFSQLHQMGVTSIRFWLFQSFTQSGNDLDRFNYVLSEADRYHIKVIPVFENQLSDCTEGGYKSPLWYTSGYQSPYGNYPLSLKDYIQKIVPLYKDNQAILMWQVMNEGQDSDVTGLYNFAKDTTEEIKDLDANHLVSLGLTATKESDADYRMIHAINSIDVLEYHDYEENTTVLPEKLKARFEDAQALHKPLIVGESGIKQHVPNRANLFQAKMDAFFQNGGAAYLIWSYGGAGVTDDTYNFDYTDPVAGVVRSTVEQIK